jgi:hypothetical protein
MRSQKVTLSVTRDFQKLPHGSPFAISRGDGAPVVSLTSNYKRLANPLRKPCASRESHFELRIQPDENLRMVATPDPVDRAPSSPVVSDAPAVVYAKAVSVRTYHAQCRWLIGELEDAMRLAILIVGSVALASCSKSIDVRDATLEEFTKAAKDVQLQKPGKWSIESRITAMDLGVPDAMITPLIREQTMQAHTSSVCVERGKPNTMSLGQTAASKTMSCRVPHFTAKNGAIDGQIVCTAPNGSMTMDEQGQYTDETLRLRILLKQSQQGQPAISNTTEVNAHRVGECAD